MSTRIPTLSLETCESIHPIPVVIVVCGFKCFRQRPNLGSFKLCLAYRSSQIGARASNDDQKSAQVVERDTLTLNYIVLVYHKREIDIGRRILVWSVGKIPRVLLLKELSSEQNVSQAKSTRVLQVAQRPYEVSHLSTSEFVSTVTSFPFRR